MLPAPLRVSGVSDAQDAPAHLLAKAELAACKTLASDGQRGALWQQAARGALYDFKRARMSAHLTIATQVHLAAYA